MANVPLIGPDQAPLLARRYYDAGDPGPIVAALANVPELLEVCVPFLGVVFGPTALADRLKEMVIVRTSARLQCRYCVATHSVAALDSGLTPAEVRALRGETPSTDVFRDPADVALLGWVDAVAGGRLDTDLLVTRTTAPLSVPAAALLRLLNGRPPGADAATGIR